MSNLRENYALHLEEKDKPAGILPRLKNFLLPKTRYLDCVQIEVTTVCAARCEYCPHTVSSGNWKSRHISDSVFSKFAPLFARSKRAHLQGWGEPFLHPSIFRYIAMAKNSGCNVSTTTCAQNITNEKAMEIARSGLDTLAFSLAGTDAKSNAVRAGTDFDALCSGIKNLHKAKIKTNAKIQVHIAYLLLADRIDALRNLPELMQELAADAAIISTLDYLAAPEHVHLAFYPDETEKIRYAGNILQEIALQAAKNGKRIHYALPDCGKSRQSACRENIEKSLYVDAAGNVSPCVYLNVPGNTFSRKIRIFGNINDSDPENIWRNEQYKRFRKSLAGGAPDIACLDCVKRSEA